MRMAAATALFWGYPAWRISRIFVLIVFLEEPLRSGMIAPPEPVLGSFILPPRSWSVVAPPGSPRRWMEPSFFLLLTQTKACSTAHTESSTWGVRPFPLRLLATETALAQPLGRLFPEVAAVRQPRVPSHHVVPDVLLHEDYAAALSESSRAATPTQEQGPGCPGMLEQISSTSRGSNTIRLSPQTTAGRSIR